MTQRSEASASFKVKYRCPEPGRERLETSPFTHRSCSRKSASTVWRRYRTRSPIVQVRGAYPVNESWVTRGGYRAARAVSTDPDGGGLHFEDPPPPPPSPPKGEGGAPLPERETIVPPKAP